jgi:hypothetical protein
MKEIYVRAEENTKKKCFSPLPFPHTPPISTFFEPFSTVFFSVKSTVYEENRCFSKTSAGHMHFFHSKIKGLCKERRKKAEKPRQNDLLIKKRKGPFRAC